MFSSLLCFSRGLSISTHCRPILDTTGFVNGALTKAMPDTHFSLFSSLFCPSLPSPFSLSLLALLSSPSPSVSAKDLSSFHLFVGTLPLSPLFIFSSWESSSAASTLLWRRTSHVWPCSTNPWSLHITPVLTTDATLILPHPWHAVFFSASFCLHFTKLL